MLHSKHAHKETYEDPKTSSVFENLMLLPDNVFWHILRTSCFYNAGMNETSGNLVSYVFWPRWSANGNDIENMNIVEPDLFIRFDEFDVIIEAKYNELGGQYQKQWEQELKAYDNEYGEEGKKVIFIAVGGNVTKDKERITVRNKIFTIYKCSWLSLLIKVNNYKKELEDISVPDVNLSATLRLLDNIILAFNINGVYNIDWFNSMETDKIVINPFSIDAINKYFTNYEKRDR